MTPVQRQASLVMLILMLMAGAAGAAWRVQGWRYEKQIAELDAGQAIAIAKAVGEIREEELRRQAAVNEVGRYAREQNKAATVDAGAADAVGDRLHVEVDRFAATNCGDPRSSQRGSSATRAAMVLSNLLKRADKRAGELAAAFDRAKIAGLACEAAYASLKLRPTD